MGDGCDKAEDFFDLRIHNPCINPKYVRIVDTEGIGLDSIQFEVDSDTTDFALDSSIFQVETYPIAHDLCGDLETYSEFDSVQITSYDWPVAFKKT